MVNFSTFFKTLIILIHANIKNKNFKNVFKYVLDYCSYMCIV